jgi:hypothetical protein
MDEAEWLTAAPPLMMGHARRVAPASARKLRLLAVAWGRFLEAQPDYADAKPVAHLGEDVLDGRRTLDALWDDRHRGWGYEGDWSIANLVLAADDRLDRAIRSAMAFAEDRGRQAGLDVGPRSAVARALVRCVLGNPFRPAAVDPRWRTADAVGLARAIYEDRAFDRLPILADALTDAGCDDEQILAHCRSSGPHVRGCWVVDLVLGKE